MWSEEVMTDFDPNVPILKQVRDRLGMSQGEFAEALGLARETVNRHERGVYPRIKFSMGQIKRLVDLLEQAGIVC